MKRATAGGWDNEPRAKDRTRENVNACHDNNIGRRGFILTGTGAMASRMVGAGAIARLARPYRSPWKHPAT
jgi:hypothetical protein